jgi:acyl carrier protein
MKKIVLSNIISLISKNTGIDKSKLNLNSCVNDFDKWDSVAHVRIMLDLEKKIKKNINTSKMSDLNSIKKIISFLK